MTGSKVLAPATEQLLPANSWQRCQHLGAHAAPGRASAKLTHGQLLAAAPVGDSTGVASHRSVDGMEVAESTGMTGRDGAKPERVRWLRRARRRSRG